TVNGTAVPVQGATANARGLVTLGLASRALKSGDQVGITWSNLKDLHGTATAGSITVTAH
ncbi:MAG: hypothetical protein JOZ57_05550, partial [Abitibacteriaceae bacterium]|nr:hypothetical protein [Abditibacteriaceae bacterium]